MAIPVANFNFNANALVVAFEDLSANIPTSWAWEFGDTGTSTLQNPNHTYAASGSYTVKLTATNVSGSNVFGYKIMVSTQLGLNITIEEMVLGELPSGVSISAILLSQNIKKWQLYLQPLVEIPFSVAENDTFDQSKWPTLVNILIAKLIVYDEIMALVRQASANAVSMSQSSSEGTTSDSSPGGIKSIQSGPSKVEWYDPNESISTVIKNAIGSGTSASQGASLVGSLALEICMLASRQRIFLPNICPPINKVFPFTVAKKRIRRCL